VFGKRFHQQSSLKIHLGNPNTKKVALTQKEIKSTSFLSFFLLLMSTVNPKPQSNVLAYKSTYGQNKWAFHPKEKGKNHGEPTNQPTQLNYSPQRTFNLQTHRVPRMQNHLYGENL
jgi:hypothetical protein